MAMARPKGSGEALAQVSKNARVGASLKAAGGGNTVLQRHPGKHQRQGTTSPEAFVQVPVWVIVPLLTSVEPE